MPRTPKSEDAKNGRRQAKDGRVYTTLRLDPDLIKRLDAECDERMVSRSWLVEKAIERLLDQELK